MIHELNRNCKCWYFYRNAFQVMPRLYLVKKRFIVKNSSAVASIASCDFFLCSCKFVLQLFPVFFKDDTQYTVQFIFNICVFLKQEKSKLATMERRIRDATRLMSTDGTNDSNAKDDVSIGTGFSYYIFMGKLI